MTDPGLFAGPSRNAAIMRGLDWSATPIGPVAGWSQSLRSAVRIVLSSRYPMLLLWGPEYTQLYNDAYAELIGDKHPAAMGGDVRVTLAEGWDVLEPLIRDAVRTGVASWVPALQLLLERSGYREEAYFSVSHAPAREDDGRTVGVFTVCSEVTEQVVGERRLRLLRDLSLEVGATRSVAQTCDDLAGSLAASALDLPFAGVYLREHDRLRRAAGVGSGGEALPVEVPLQGEVADADPWGLRAAASGTTARVAVPPAIDVPSGPWGDRVPTALALPLPSADRGRPLGVLLAGVSAARALDESYASFFDLLAQQVSVALRNARAHEEERARVAALAELDRAKTSFFTNVSHEFRTPLTLLLGPLGDALDDRTAPLPPAQLTRVETAIRNAQRLSKLVNDLLAFASIEAGRTRLHPRRTDLAARTADLASAFRSAVERVGLEFVVEVEPPRLEVVIDPDAWERVVVNLLSNALKFTLVGRITVRLTTDSAGVALSVADTGIGLAPEELERLFERFHRVQGARGRSHEGSGIGLALVRELARLSGGDVAVTSEAGVGTTFTVRLPWAALQGPVGDDQGAGEAPDGARSAVVRAALDEVALWSPDGSAGTPQAPAAPGVTVARDAVPLRGRDPLRGMRVLLADDNADMRAYVRRLLEEQGWHVEAVEDGAAALAAVERELPDVVLSDVMMPELDGFELVHELRRRPATATLPVLLISARAGQEASVEGLDLGADDYLVKPFTARELVARVRSAVALARLRVATDPDQRVAAGGSGADGSGARASGAASDTAGPGTPPPGAPAPPEPARHAAGRRRSGAAAGTAPAGPGSVQVDGEEVAGPPTARTAAPRANRSTAAAGVDGTVVHAATYPAVPSSAAAVRRDLRRALGAAGVDDGVVDELLSAVSEAVNNAVEHAQSPSRDEIAVRVTTDPSRVRVDVRDFGRWRERPPAMDRGRGSTLMAAFATVEVAAGDDGTTVSLVRELAPSG